MSEQELGEEDEKSPFDLETLGMSKNWMLNVFRDAVKSNNYPVIGLFFVGFGTIMKMAGSDFPIISLDARLRDIQTGSSGLPLSQLHPLTAFIDFIISLLPAANIRNIGDLPLRLNLSDLLIAAGIGLMGAPIIGKLIPSVG